MSDVVRSEEIPLLLGPPSLAEASPEPLRFRAPEIHNHRPGQYCYFCPCYDCCRFYGKGSPYRCVEPVEPMKPIPPRYSDIRFVNCMRAAAAKREEVRQDKRTEADQAKKKTLRTSMKRHRV